MSLDLREDRHLLGAVDWVDQTIEVDDDVEAERPEMKGKRGSFPTLISR